MDAAVERDLAKLAGLQNDDGGFGWWARDRATRRRARRPSPPSTSSTPWRAPRPRATRPPTAMLRRAQEYLRRHRRAPGPVAGDRRGAAHPEGLRPLHPPAAGRPQRRRGRAACSASPASARWTRSAGCWPCCPATAASAAEVAEIRRQLNNRASEEAATAQFTTDYEESAGNVVLASDRRADAVVLEALIGDQPDNPLIPKLARGLLDHRVKGRWGSTQENAFVLLALDRYFRTYERDDAGLRGPRLAGRGLRRREHVPGPQRGPLRDEGALRRRSRRRAHGPRAGQGRPRPALLPPGPALRAGRACAWSRSPAASRSPGSTRRWTIPTTSGAWPTAATRCKAGARVRVRLNMVADSRRYHVALVDPLPAGLEALNPELAVTGTPAAGPGARPGRGRLERVVGPLLVRAPGAARRADRGVHQPAGPRPVRAGVPRARHHARHLRRAAHAGRGAVPPRDLRARRARTAVVVR